MSRNDGHSRSLRRRPSRSIPASVVSLVILGVSVGLAWVAIARMMNGTWPTFLEPLRTWLGSARWDDGAVWAVGILMAVAGIVLLLCALIPGAYSVLRVDAPSSRGAIGSGGTQEIVIARRAVANLARSESEAIDGVEKATASAGDTRVHVSVTTPLRDPGAMRQQIVEAVSTRLRESGINPVPKVSATVVSKP